MAGTDHVCGGFVGGFSRTAGSGQCEHTCLGSFLERPEGSNEFWVTEVSFGREQYMDVPGAQVRRTAKFRKVRRA